MKQLQLVDVDVGELLQGMYIANLDRPWLGSPFLLEGFLLEDPADLETLRGLCSFVQVDVARSAATCQPWLLARLGPLDKPTQPERLPPPRLASATLMQAPGTAPDERRRDSASHSILADLATITRETLRGNANGDAATEGPTVWRDTDQNAPASKAGTAGTDGPLPPGASAAGRDGTDQPWMSSVGSVEPVAGKDGRRWPRGPRHQVGLDTAADSENLGGTSLVVPQGRDWRPTEELKHAHRIKDTTYALIGEFLADAESHRALDVDKAQTVIAEMSDSLQRNPESLRWLSHLKRKDDYSYTHAFDCAVHMMAFSQFLGYGRETKEILGLAGLVIDLGKIRLSTEILRHPGRLSQAQFEKAKEHVLHSIDILKSSPKVSTKVLEIVAQHHERLDGSGYPYKLKGKELSPIAAIAGIVDTFTALTSKRPHEAPVSIHTALTRLQHHAGRLFNEGLVEEFIQYVGIYPVGTLVELNTGEVAVVVSQNRVRRLKPTVMVLLGGDREALRYPQIINLMQDVPSIDANTPYSIHRDLPPGSYDLDPTEFYLDVEAA